MGWEVSGEQYDRSVSREGVERESAHKERTGTRGAEECGLEWESGPESGSGKRGWESTRCLSTSSDELSCRRQWQ